MSDIDELARRIRVIEAQQQFMGAGFNSVEPVSLSRALSASYITRLAGVRSYWPLSAFDGNGDVLDVMSGYTLTRTGTLLENATSVFNGAMYFNGTSTYLSRADGASVEYNGTSGWIASARRGVTISLWYIRGSAVSSQQALVAKWPSAGNLSFAIQFRTGVLDYVTCGISGDGTTQAAYTHSTEIQNGTWYHIVMRYVPSTSLDVYINNVKETRTATIPASIYNGNGVFNIGARNSSSEFLGPAYMRDVFITDTWLRDDQIEEYYNLSSPQYR